MYERKKAAPQRRGEKKTVDYYEQVKYSIEISLLLVDNNKTLQQL